MRPVNLTIEGLRSFRRPVTVGFADRELIAIIGDTGAGKSSILEALTWALYGNATWTKQAGALLGDGSPQMRVRLVFRADGNTWQVTRALRRRQDGNPGAASAELLCLDGERPAADGVRPVNEAVQKLLGLDWAAFTRTVVLPQGQFARLLTEGDVDRMHILAQIWRTDELVEARTRTDEALRDLEAHLARLRGRRETYPDDVAAELTAATSAAETAKTAAKAIDTTAEAVERCEQAAKDAAGRARTVQTAVRKLHASLDGDHVREAEALATAGAELTNQLEDFKQRITAQRKQVERLREAEAEQATEREAVKQQAATLERLAESMPHLANRMGQVNQLRTDATTQHSEAKALAEDAEKAQERGQDAEGAVAQWQRVHAAASAAHGLHPGDDCPVCARALPGAWEAPDASGLEAAQRAQAAARAEARKLHDRHTQKAAEAKGTAKRAQEEATALAGELERISEAVAQLPEPYRPVLPAPFTVEALQPEQLSEELVATARSTARARLDELTAVEDKVRTARDALNNLREQHNDALDRLSINVTQPVTTLRNRLQQVCERVSGCEEAGVELPAAVPELGEALQQLIDDATTVDSLADTTLERSEATVQQAEDEAATQKQRLSALLEEADVTSIKELTDHRVQLHAEGREAHQRCEELKRTAPIVEALDRHITKGSEAAGALTDLKTAVQDGKFIRWLTLRRSKGLLAVASTLLDEMTGGRYAFADITAGHDEWRIFDTETGYARSPRTLSGGESFVASLALALGMVEMVARSGGRLDALFLDEGFGALDRENLDAAVDALESSATIGRMVAVISHVQAVAERLTDVLAVDRAPTGSNVRWLTQSEREGLAIEEASTSVRNLLT